MQASSLGPSDSRILIGFRAPERPKPNVRDILLRCVCCSRRNTRFDYHQAASPSFNSRSQSVFRLSPKRVEELFFELSVADDFYSFSLL